MKITINNIKDDEYVVHEENNLSVVEKNITGNENMLQHIIQFFNINLEDDENIDTPIEEDTPEEDIPVEQSDIESIVTPSEEVVDDSSVSTSFDDIKVDYQVNASEIIQEAKKVDILVANKPVMPINNPVPSVPTETMKDVIEQDHKENVPPASTGWANKRKKSWGAKSTEIRD